VSAITVSGTVSMSEAIRIGTISAFGATPMIRSSPAARPAMRPAIGVPWLSQSSTVVFSSGDRRVLPEGVGQGCAAEHRRARRVGG
jgi:hypothetical protein